ncbi:MAG: hypothetical protein ACJAW0_001116 [Zhongshania sp.]|jgi:hypothetical protein
MDSETLICWEKSMDKAQTDAIEAAVFRRLLAHLDERKDVQNIDLMNLAGFCRNCLSKWYVAAAKQDGVTVNYEAARERVYGMPYSQWKAEFQVEASAEQLAGFVNNNPEKK